MPLRLVASHRFLSDYADLPQETRHYVDRALRCLAENPGHPPLRLRKLHGFEGTWEARISKAYRLTCRLGGSTFISATLRNDSKKSRGATPAISMAIW